MSKSDSRQSGVPYLPPRRQSLEWGGNAGYDRTGPPEAGAFGPVVNHHPASKVPLHWRREPDMPESIYKVVELVGSSPESWEKAAAAAVKAASASLRDLRVAEVIQLDAHIGKDGSIESYRAKIRVSFKYEGQG